MSPLKLGLVDDHRLFREGMRALLSTQSDFQLVGEASQAQDAYSLVNLRFAAVGRFLTGELLIRNAFDTHYVPVAFAFRGFAPSGFLGESGRPRTFGVSVGVFR